LLLLRSQGQRKLSKLAEEVGWCKKSSPGLQKRHFDPVPQTLALASILGHVWVIHNAGIRKPNLANHDVNSPLQHQTEPMPMSKTEQIVISSDAMLRKSRGQAHSRAGHRHSLQGMTDSTTRSGGINPPLRRRVMDKT
jgi:hypothetical protein